MMQGMVIGMDEAQMHLGAGQGILDRTAEVTFRVPKARRHWFIEPVVKWFGAVRCWWADQGMLLRDIEHVTRLVRPYSKDGKFPNRPRHQEVDGPSLLCAQ